MLGRSSELKTPTVSDGDTERMVLWEVRPSRGHGAVDKFYNFTIDNAGCS